MNDAVRVLTINEPVIFNEPESVGIVMYFMWLNYSNLYKVTISIYTT
jgi:hypothetical protein